MLDQPETLTNSEIGNDCVTLFCNSGPPICGMTSAEGMEVEISSSRISTLEPYLLQIKDSVMRSLCCLRISCHPLQIERGRYHWPRPIPAGQRYCPLWHKRGRDAVEDETHFLLECNSYADERCLLFQSTAANLPSLFSSLGVEQKFVLTSSMDPTVIMCIAKFVHACFLKRNELISCLCSD